MIAKIEINVKKFFFALVVRALVINYLLLIMEVNGDPLPKVANWRP